MIGYIRNRIISDYFIGNRIDDLYAIYNLALKENYIICSVEGYWNLLMSGKIENSKKYLINRHDIDSDVKTAKLLFNLEKDLNIKSSFYFRLCTLNYNFMNEISSYGSEASYHFEEVATLAKLHGWKSRSQIDWAEVKNLFCYNFSTIKLNSGLNLSTVCSHGDFVNRYLKVINNELLDNDIRVNLGINLEVYDRSLVDTIEFKCSDTEYPKYYTPSSPFEFLSQNYKVIEFLTHPRHWYSRWTSNSIENFKRVSEDLLYKLR